MRNRYVVDDGKEELEAHIRINPKEARRSLEKLKKHNLIQVCDLADKVIEAPVVKDDGSLVKKKETKVCEQSTCDCDGI